MAIVVALRGASMPRPAAQDEPRELSGHLHRVPVADDHTVPPSPLGVKDHRGQAGVDGRELPPAVTTAAPDRELAGPGQPRQAQPGQPRERDFLDVHHAEALDRDAQLAPPGGQALEGLEAHDDFASFDDQVGHLRLGSLLLRAQFSALLPV
jgi:hypothetical protein